MKDKRASASAVDAAPRAAGNNITAGKQTRSQRRYGNVAPKPNDVSKDVPKDIYVELWQMVEFLTRVAKEDDVLHQPMPEPATPTLKRIELPLVGPLIPTPHDEPMARAHRREKQEREARADGKPPGTMMTPDLPVLKILEALGMGQEEIELSPPETCVILERLRPIVQSLKAADPIRDAGAVRPPFAGAPAPSANPKRDLLEALSTFRKRFPSFP